MAEDSYLSCIGDTEYLIGLIDKQDIFHKFEVILLYKA